MDHPEHPNMTDYRMACPCGAWWVDTLPAGTVFPIECPACEEMLGKPFVPNPPPSV